MLKEFYTDNYKGFKNQFITFKRGNFFVGENSSGKSSIINLIDVIMKTDEIDFANTDWYDTVFVDLKTKNSKRQHIHIGFSDDVEETIFDNIENETEDVKFKTFQTTYYFYYKIAKSSDGYPTIKKGLMFNARTKNLVGFNYDKKEIKYISGKRENIKSFTNFIEKVNYYKFKKYKESVSHNRKIPLHYLFTTATERNQQENIFSFGGNTKTKMFSPIRSLPKAIYNKTRENEYSSSGEHIPNTLASRILNNEKLLELINSFGKESGLFDKLEINYLTKGRHSQFTIQVHRGGTITRIDQVGTGVGQVLPIICEVVNNRGDALFLFKQPELHLHPKAQSSLGKFLFNLNENRSRYSFIAETHSEYLINSYRREVGRNKRNDTVIQFFSEENKTKVIYSIEIDENGRYKGEGLNLFRKFYLDESMKNLDL